MIFVTLLTLGIPVGLFLSLVERKRQKKLDKEGMKELEKIKKEVAKEDLRHKKQMEELEKEHENLIRDHEERMKEFNELTKKYELYRNEMYTDQDFDDVANKDAYIEKLDHNWSVIEKMIKEMRKDGILKGDGIDAEKTENNNNDNR